MGKQCYINMEKCYFKTFSCLYQLPIRKQVRCEVTASGSFIKPRCTSRSCQEQRNLHLKTPNDKNKQHKKDKNKKSFCFKLKLN